jgi:RNA polymerase sigma-70 factor (ECF subfamily)
LPPQSKISLLEQLFRRHQPALVAFANGFVRSPEDAKEVVQEVFISVWQNVENLNPDENLRAYLFTATRNKSLNFLAKKRLPTVDAEVGTMERFHSTQNEAASDVAELQAVIFSEVKKLPEKCREIFILSRQEGLSYKEIAERTGLSVKTVENQIGIALGRLKKTVEDYRQERGRFSVRQMMWLILFGLESLEWLRVV